MSQSAVAEASMHAAPPLKSDSSLALMLVTLSGEGRLLECLDPEMRPHALLERANAELCGIATAHGATPRRAHPRRIVAAILHGERRIAGGEESVAAEDTTLRSLGICDGDRLTCVLESVWRPGKPFAITADGVLLPSVCSDPETSSVCLQSGWVGVLHAVDNAADTASVNFYHKPPDALDEIPLAVVVLYPLVAGSSFRLIDDDAELVRLCRERSIGYVGGFANGWEGVIWNIDYKLGKAMVRYNQKAPHARDAIPLGAAMAKPVVVV